MLKTNPEEEIRTAIVFLSAWPGFIVRLLENGVNIRREKLVDWGDHNDKSLRRRITIRKNDSVRRCCNPNCDSAISQSVGRTHTAVEKLNRPRPKRAPRQPSNRLSFGVFFTLSCPSTFLLGFPTFHRIRL